MELSTGRLGQAVGAAKVSLASESGKTEEKPSGDCGQPPFLYSLKASQNN